MAKKAEEKDVKNTKKKTEAKKVKKTTEKAKKESFFAGVKTELSKVKWPTKKEVVKYTIATLIFIIVLVVFFVLLSLLMSFIKGAFN